MRAPCHSAINSARAKAAAARRGLAGLVGLCLLAGAGRAHAASAVPSPTFGILNAVAGLAVVVALIFAIAWLMRRIGGPAGFQKGPMRVLGATSVGQRERVVLVRYQDSILVLGVAPGQVTLLKESAAAPEGAASHASAVPSFIARLRAATGKAAHD